jgi:hypothetical protein
MYFINTETICILSWKLPEICMAYAHVHILQLLHCYRENTWRTQFQVQLWSQSMIDSIDVITRGANSGYNRPRNHCSHHDLQVGALQTNITSLVRGSGIASKFIREIFLVICHYRQLLSKCNASSEVRSIYHTHTMPITWYHCDIIIEGCLTFGGASGWKWLTFRFDIHLRTSCSMLVIL